MNRKWDNRFIILSLHVADWSKDPSTQLGAVIAKGKHVISVGYNGFPKDDPDTHEDYHNREIKYSKIIHAERNAICNAKEIGITDFTDMTLYVCKIPCCDDCAEYIAKTGIKHVVMEKSAIDKDYQEMRRKHITDGNANYWQESWEKSKKVFDKNGIEYIFI